MQCSWRESLPLGKTAGFGGSDVEFDLESSAGEIRDALALHELQAGGAMAPVDFMSPETNTKEGLAHVEKVARLAAEIGCTRFTRYILSFSDELTWKENFRWHVEQFRPIAGVMADHGCSIGLEFLGPRTLRDGHKHAFIHTMHPMLDLCEQIGPNCGLLLDSWHWYTSLGIVEDILELRPEQVVYVHINDAPRDVPVEQHQDFDRALAGETGVIDLHGFLGALRKIGYDGPVTPEPFISEFENMSPADVLARVGPGFREVWE
jgi:sugar phosphate isomerase/epimerase